MCKVWSVQGTGGAGRRRMQVQALDMHASDAWRHVRMPHAELNARPRSRTMEKRPIWVYDTRDCIRKGLQEPGTKGTGLCR